MLNLEDIKPRVGVIPPRPASLQRPSEVVACSTDEAIVELLRVGKVAVFSGLSLIGEGGHMVYVIGLLQVKNKNLQGWLLLIGHPDKKEPDFSFIDTSADPLMELPFPNTITYFVGEADEKLVAADAPQEELQAIARFILPFISDEGPPNDIDW